MSRMVLLLLEMIAVATLAMVASSHFGIADGARITAAFAVAYVVPLVLLRRARGTSDAAHLLLLLLAVFLSWVALDSMQHWIELDGYSLQRPNLHDDSRRYYKWALHHYDGSVGPASSVFPGFPLMMLALWKLFGLSVIWPLAMNMMCTMTSVVLTGMTTRRLLSHRVKLPLQVLLLGGMLLPCLMPYYLMSGISILKEGIIFLSVSMAGFSLSSMVTVDEDRFSLWRDIVTFVVACLLVALVRTTFLYVLLLGLFIMTLPHWRRDWILTLCLTVMIIVLLFVGNYFASYSFDRHAEIVSGGWNMQRIYFKNTFYTSVIGYYFLYSPWHKFLMLPVTMPLQFILPLPWVPPGSASNLLTIFCRVTYGWYLIGGVFVFYALFLSWRRDGSMGVWPWWPMIYYVALAYVMGGVMARYLLPAVPLIVPVVVYVLCRVYEGRWRRMFTWWMIFLVVTMTLVLLACLEMQTGAVSSFLHVDRIIPYPRTYPSL